ncbi:MAG: C40 family peptidase [Parcubacteria group bacterium]|nr:C40 family peptidase [Parcubacteria group bacterium]
MEYRAVGNRCAVSLDSLHLPLSREETLAMLTDKGFTLVEVDIVALARQRIGTSCFRDYAKPRDAPWFVDCSGLVRWLYAQRGIWLPRLAIEQRRLGEVIALEEITAGDVVFVTGCVNLYDTDPNDGVGHVGIATGEGTIVNAANERVNVVETPLRKFVGGAEKSRLRGIRRYIPKSVEVLTFETPHGEEVEISADIRWIILQSLSKKQRKHA